MYHHAEAPVPPHGPAGAWASRGAAVPRRDGAGAHGARRRPRRGKVAAGRASRWCTARPAAPRSALKKNLWAPAAVGTRFDLSPSSLRAARALPRLPHHRQQHRRAQRRSVHAAGDRRRPLPLERGVPDAGASEADAGLGRLRRHLARPALRAEVRPGHADPVDAAVHRERRPGRRLRLRLLVRLHRLDQLGVADRAAADDPRPARGVRSAVRRRRHAGGARGAPRDGQEHPRLARPRGRRGCSKRPRRRRSRAPRPTTSTTSARSSAASSRSRRTTAAASRASCPARRSACPTRSTSTSS